MGAFFPAGLLAAVDGWILDANPLHVAWHTALPDTSGSNEYSLNGAARLPTGTLTTSSDAAKATATNAAEIISAAASDAWSAITHLSFVKPCERRHVSGTRRSRLSGHAGSGREDPNRARRSDSRVPSV